MPELPEVETIARDLRSVLVGRQILGVQNDWSRHINRPGLLEFQERIRGRKIQNIDRRGKYLILILDNGETLIIHLKMSGQLFVVNAGIPTDKYVHTTFLLDDGNELRFRDVRKFGRVYLVRYPDEVLGELGPEPFSEFFTVDWFHANLQRRRRVLKPLLLDQTFIAGIGNIYADEALFRSKLYPKRISNTLSFQESTALHSSIQEVLKQAIERQGASFDAVYRRPDGTEGNMQKSFAVYGRAGEACPRCGSDIQRIVIGSRSSHFCNICQV